MVRDPSKKQIQIRIDAEVEQGLRDEALRRRVSFAWLCDQLLAEGLERLQPPLSKKVKIYE
jgi:hypothetical protein